MYSQCKRQQYYCKAFVTERDGMFHAWNTSHNHAVEVGAVTMAKMVIKVKAEVLEDKFKPASTTVTEVITAI